MTGNSNDDLTANAPPRVLPSVEDKGSDEAKALALLFQKLLKDGLTADERKTIERFDGLLKGVESELNESGTTLTIVQTDGKRFVVGNKPTGNSR